MTEPRYADPGALRQAIADRLRRVARDRPGAQLSDLQRQFAYDRLLARVFSTEPEAWVLKGATALLARLHGAARHTLDIDHRHRAGLDLAEAALRAAASADLGDHFRFTLEPGRRIAEGRATLRVPVTAYLGATVFAHFHVDLVSGVLMTGEPDDVSPLVPVELPGIMSVHYRVYPIVDHIADKVCALVELHPRAGRPPQASTRHRDLADLAVIARTQPVDATALHTALASESDRRGMELPPALSAPEAPGWRTGYARVAKDVPDLAERDLDAAMVTVKRFLDPILGGTATGTWRPDQQDWT